MKLFKMRPGPLFLTILVTGSSWACTEHPPTVRPSIPKPIASPVTPAQHPPPAPTLTEAITKLETFLQRPDLSAPMRADALFRLAALKEDQIRHTPGASLPLHFEPSIEIYQTLIRDYPDQHFIPDVHYFLAHALADSGRNEESQQIFRTIICQNHFTYSPPSDSKAPIVIQRLPQDHERAFWTAWEAKHPHPARRPAKSASSANADEMVFVNPYPPDCRAMSQKSLGEVWFRMGDYHFEQLDAFAGPYSLNRAAVAYGQAARLGPPLIRTLAHYKLAWTLYKQQRYAAAVEQFVELLKNGDETSLTGISGLNLRKEACTYIADSLTFLDFQGPGPDEPYIPREDVLDTEKDPHRAEQKMRVGIERVRYGKIVPQDEPWTSDVYAALFDEYNDLSQSQNMIEVGEALLAKWPNHARAADIRKEMDQAKLLNKLP